MVRLILAAASLVIAATPTLAAPCRDAHGKFVACPKPVAVTHMTTVKTTTTKTISRCRDVKGHFAKCGTAGTHPA